MAQATLAAGDLKAVVGDNAGEGPHARGYNGVWSLRHTQCPREVFVPSYAGLNFEHIFDGATDDTDARVFFEPRVAPMELRTLSPTAAELHQPPTPVFKLESWTRFQVVAPHFLDMVFRCRAHQHVFRNGYIGLFWASYIDAPEDKSIYFLGGEAGAAGLWTQLCTQRHGMESTVRQREDAFEPAFRAENRQTLFRAMSALRYDMPFFYGNFEGFVLGFFFDRTQGVRFAHSPSGGGLNPDRRTTCPAWDFQLLIPEYDVRKDYTLRVRVMFRPRCPRREIEEEYARWRASLP